MHAMVMSRPQSLWSLSLAGVRSGYAALAVAACMTLGIQEAVAQHPSNNRIDMSLDALVTLPAYCADAQSGSNGGRYDPANYTPAQQRWVALMGGGFHHIHHYCWALDMAKKARDPMTSQQQRRSFYSGAIKDCTYVLNQAPRDFVLLPEIYLRMGQFALGRDDIVGALEYFENSYRAKPDYWPPYVEIAKTNLSIGRRQEAEAALKAGLAVSPDEPNLKQALAQLKATPPARAKKPPSK